MPLPLVAAALAKHDDAYSERQMKIRYFPVPGTIAMPGQLLQTLFRRAAATRCCKMLATGDAVAEPARMYRAGYCHVQLPCLGADRAH